ITRFATQPLGPVHECFLRGGEEPFELFGVELARELHRGETGAVQDLVRICVADAAEEARVGERPLERMALADERGAKVPEVRLEDLESAGVVSVEGRLAAYDVERCAFLRAGFGDEQCPARKIDDCKTEFAGRLRP